MPISSGIMFLMYRTRGCGPLVHKTTPAASGGAERRPRPEGVLKSAAKGIIEAGARKPRPDKRRAMGRIEHTLLVGDGVTSTDLRPSPVLTPPTPPYHKKLQMFLSKTNDRNPVALELRPYDRIRC